MVTIDPATLSNIERYALATACVVPRPIAWVSTLDASDVANLAPFSFFGAVTSEPPTVMLSVGRRRGAQKDTAKNILATKEAVVHIPTRKLASQMVHSSAEVHADVDEFELVGLARKPATRVRPFVVADAAIAMETVMIDHREVGRGPVDLFLLEVVLFHVADDVVVDGRPDPSRMRALGRLGGQLYCDTAQVFEIARPR